MASLTPVHSSAMSETTSPPVYFLLVDDLDENLLALEGLLRRDGLVLLRATSGEAALEHLLAHDVALALVDVQMPKMDGFELAELMRGTEKTRRVPIIFLTAGGNDWGRRFRGYEMGAVDFLQKPFEPDILKSKTDVFFDLYRQRQEVARQRDELKSVLDENARLLDESRQYARALQEADRRKDEFLATLAHELRNPLAPILNAVQILQMFDEPTGNDRHNREVHELRDMIERQVTHMVRLVDDLLDVSRITRGKVNLHHEQLPIADVLQNAVDTSKPLIASAKHSLTVSLPPVPLYVNGDMVRLTQVFANLLNNAAKYTPEGGAISLSAERDGQSIVVRVRDSGVGIPKEMLDHVFEMFAQVNQHLKRSQGGLGIGLTLVKRLVEMHAGRIYVQSEGEGKGAEFVVHLPMAPSDGTDMQTTSDTRLAMAPIAQRVLVIDDNVDAACTLSTLLKLNGYEVDVTHDGKQGIEQIKAFRPKFVLLDLGMPGMDGYETARTIRSLPGGSDIVLIAITGWGQSADRTRTKDFGFDYHFVKPVDSSALQELLGNLSG